MAAAQTKVAQLEEELLEVKQRGQEAATASTALHAGHRNDQRLIAEQSVALESSQTQVGAVTRQVVRLEEKIALLERAVDESNSDRERLQNKLRETREAHEQAQAQAQTDAASRAAVAATAAAAAMATSQASRLERPERRTTLEVEAGPEARGLLGRLVGASEMVERITALEVGFRGPCMFTNFVATHKYPTE